jgi:hypothetical protein
MRGIGLLSSRSQRNRSSSHSERPQAAAKAATDSGESVWWAVARTTSSIYAHSSICTTGPKVGVLPLAGPTPASMVGSIWLASEVSLLIR